MASEYDLGIRSGSVIDGTGVDRRIADVAVKDGRIAVISAVKGRGAEEIDAQGLLDNALTVFSGKLQIPRSRRQPGRGLTPSVRSLFIRR